MACVQAFRGHVEGPRPAAYSQYYVGHQRGGYAAHAAEVARALEADEKERVEEAALRERAPRASRELGRRTRGQSNSF